MELIWLKLFGIWKLATDAMNPFAMYVVEMDGGLVEIQSAISMFNWNETIVSCWFFVRLPSL